MAVAKLDPNWWEHSLPLGAAGLWASAISWSVQHRRSLVPDRFVSMIGASEVDAEALADSGYWYRTEGGWHLTGLGFKPDYRDDAEIERARMTPSLRAWILERDGCWCIACGWPHIPEGATDGVGLHIDHILPIARGGRTVADNLTVLCAPCNLNKGDFTLDEWMFARLTGERPQRGVVWEVV